MTKQPVLSPIFGLISIISNEAWRAYRRPDVGRRIVPVSIVALRRVEMERRHCDKWPDYAERRRSRCSSVRSTRSRSPIFRHRLFALSFFHSAIYAQIEIDTVCFSWMRNENQADFRFIIYFLQFQSSAKFRLASSKRHCRVREMDQSHTPTDSLNGGRAKVPPPLRPSVHPALTTACLSVCPYPLDSPIHVSVGTGATTSRLCASSLASCGGFIKPARVSKTLHALSAPSVVPSPSPRSR